MENKHNPKQPNLVIFFGCLVVLIVVVGVVAFMAVHAPYILAAALVILIGGFGIDRLIG